MSPTTPSREGYVTLPLPIDVHVVYDNQVPPDWLQKCVSSLDGVTVHMVPHRGRTLGACRAEGFRKGNHPYVSYVDADDWVEPGTFTLALAQLKKSHHCCGVYSAYTSVDSDGGSLRRVSNPEWTREKHLSSPNYVHQLMVMHRAAVEFCLDDALAYGEGFDPMLRAHIVRAGDWLHLPVLGYNYRQHPDQHHSALTERFKKRISVSYREVLLDIYRDNLPKGGIHDNF